MNFQLFDFQRENVQSIRERYRSGDGAVLYQLSTGGGKTYTFCYIAEAAAKLGNRVWILVHRAELIRQTSESLRVIGVHHGIIAPGFTPDPFANIQVCSVQTLVRRLGKLLPPHLIIVDECHHTIAATYAKILAFYSKARVLGVTATPVRMDGQGLGRHCGGHYDSMVNGPPFSALVAMKRLCMPRIFAPPIGVDFGGLHKRYGDFIKDEVASAMDKPVITGCAVEHYNRISPNVPAIAFCASVAHAENVAEEFRRKGFQAASIDGKMDDTNRKRRISDLGNGGLHVLTSCDLISEGTDVPVVGTAILLRPSASLSMVLQQIGRAARVADGKTHFNVIDHVANTERHELQGLGRPEWDIDWTLDGEVKKNKKNSATGPGFKQCPKCYSVHAPAPACPICHHAYESNARELEQVDGSLKEIDPATLERLQKIETSRERFSRLNEERACKSYQDFLTLARRRGHKDSWAGIRWQQVKNRRASTLPGV